MGSFIPRVSLSIFLSVILSQIKEFVNLNKYDTIDSMVDRAAGTLVIESKEILSNTLSTSRKVFGAISLLLTVLSIFYVSIAEFSCLLGMLVLV